MCAYQPVTPDPQVLSSFLCSVCTALLAPITFLECVPVSPSDHKQTTDALGSGRPLQLTVMRQHTESHHTLWTPWQISLKLGKKIDVSLS